MKTIPLKLVSLSIALLVVGCGGGGGSTPSATVPVGTVKITATNANTAAKGAVTPSQTVAKQGSAGASAGKAAAQPGAPRKSVMDIALAQLKHMKNLSLPAATGSVTKAALAPFPITFGCGVYASTNSYTGNLNSSKGTEAWDVQGADINHITSITFAYTNCVAPNPTATNASATTTTNGSMTITIGSQSGGVLNSSTGQIEGTTASPLVESDSMSFNNYTVVDTAPVPTETLAMTGGITLSTSDNGTKMTVTMEGASFASTIDTDTFTMKDFSIVMTDDSPTATSPTGAYSYSIAMTITSTAADLSGDIVITTPTLFTGVGSGNPTAGSMKISGSDGSYLTLTAKSNGTDLTMSGYDGSAAFGPSTVAWSAL